MKRLLSIFLLTLLIPSGALAQLRVSQGGTGWGAITSGSILFGNSALYLATSSALSFNSAGNRLTVTNGSTTALSATVFCLTGDVCRTTWPTSGSGGSGNVSTSSVPVIGNLAYWTSTTTTPALLSTVATTSLAFSGPFSGGSALGALVGGSNSTVTWTGLATTSQPSSSNLLVSNGAAGVYAVATSSGTVSTPLTGNFVCVGSGCTLGIQAANASQNGYLSSTDYSLFHTATTTFSSPLSYSISTNAVTCPTCQTSATTDFSYLTNYGQTMAATTTPLWAKSGIYASSTSQLSTTTIPVPFTLLLGTATTSKQSQGGGGPESIGIQRTNANDAAIFSGVTNDINARWLVQANGLMGWGAGAGSDQDINFYRSGAGALTVQSGTTNSTDAFRVNQASGGTGTSILDVNTTSGYVSTPWLLVNGAGGGAKVDVAGGGSTAFRAQGNAASDVGFSSFVTNDAQLRFSFLSDGTLKWGPGTAVADTNLYRVSTSTLKTDNSLTVGSVLALSATTSSLLATDASGNVIATSSVGANYITGALGNVNTNAPLGGGGSLTRGGTLTLTCTNASNGVTGCMSSTDWGLLHTATTTFSSPLSYSATTNAVTCPTCQTSAAAWPWTSATTYATTTQATTSPAWFQGNLYSLFASSTAVLTNASTSQLTSFGSTWLTGTTNAILGTDNNGLIAASSSIGANYITGTLGNVNTNGPLGGGGGLTRGGTLTLTCSTCNIYGWPWIVATTFGTTTNSTTTPTWYKTGLFASSTSQLDYASTTAISATTICLTSDTCRTTWPAAGASVWPFTTTDTNFGVAVQSTTTPEWFKNGLHASSTNQFLNENIWGTLTLNATTSRLLATDSTGIIVGTSSIGTNLLTGTLGAGNGGTGATSLSAAFAVISNVFSNKVTRSFTISTSTAWTGSTTRMIEQVGVAETINFVRCSTNVGTLNVQLGILTASTTMFNASTTNNQMNLTSNNVLAAGNKLSVEIGTPATAPTQINCSINITI